MRTLAILSLAVPLAAPLAWSHDDDHHGGAPAQAANPQKPWGIAGDPRHARTVEVRMLDAMRFAPQRIEVREGETIRFVLRNDGQVPHEMVIGTQAELAAHAAAMKASPGMQHDEPSMARVPPAGQGELVWTFNRPGSFSFACLVPGHLEAGMKGTIVVVPKTAPKTSRAMTH